MILVLEANAVIYLIEGAEPFAGRVRRQLQALVDGDWGELDGTALFSETRQMVEKWGEYYLARPIRSMRLLD